MPQCKAKFCNVKRGQGISAFAIPDPKKNRQLCQQWIHNLGTKNLDIKTYKYSKQNIVCEKHFEEGRIKTDKQVTLSLSLFLSLIMLLNCKPSDTDIFSDWSGFPMGMKVAWTLSYSECIAKILVSLDTCPGLSDTSMCAHTEIHIFYKTILPCGPFLCRLNL